MAKMRARLPKIAPPDCAITSDSERRQPREVRAADPEQEACDRQHRHRQHQRLAGLLQKGEASPLACHDGVSSGHERAHFGGGRAFQRARRRASRHSLKRNRRICALTAGIAGTLTLSSSTPRPTSNGTACGSPAMPPQTPVQRPCVCERANRHVDQPQHRGREAVDLRREPGVTTIHRERVLREIVGADREEVHLAGELVGEQRGGRRPRP